MSDTTPRRRGVLDIIELLGNKLPDPSALFLIGAVIVMIASAIASNAGWQVQPKAPQRIVDEATGVASLVLVETGDPIEAKNLLTREGIFWCFNSMVDNFINFPPLGIVLVGMLGIGIAERTGLISVLLRMFMLITPAKLLTPAMVFLGIMSSLASDAGYVVLPPLAALLYLAAGRSPLAGIAAVFAGVAAGFNANLVVTGLDPLLAEFTSDAAQIVDSEYVVAPTCNWAFMVASTFVVTLVGWAVSAWFVERRLSKKPPEEGGPTPIDEETLAAQKITPKELRATLIAVITGALTIGGIILLIAIPDAPLHGKVDPNQPRSFDRWVAVIVPLLMIGFIIPGLAYGVAMGTVRTSKDAAKMMVDSMAAMGPIIVLAFFAGQFIEYFKYSNLGTMLAMTGGQALADANMPPQALIIVLILITAAFNMFVGSMSAKYALFAPIFVPMLMLVGISPELTQVAYRIGDSTTNIITPLNAYLVIILVFMQKYVPKAGMGTLVSIMLPYSIVFTIVWSIMLVVWMTAGWSLGLPASTGPLEYIPAP
jgi:aminobenzoyl-glutamate transport protein